MCLAVYMACDIPIPSTSWDANHPGFYVKQAAQDDVVRTVFSHPYVAYIGSHESCGCGFIKQERAEDEHAICQENYNRLAMLIEQLMRLSANVELFVCWEGDQSKPPLIVETVSQRDIRQPQFELRERHKILIA